MRKKRLLYILILVVAIFGTTTIYAASVGSNADSEKHEMGGCDVAWCYDPKVENGTGSNQMINGIRVSVVDKNGNRVSNTTSIDIIADSKNVENASNVPLSKTTLKYKGNWDLKISEKKLTRNEIVNGTRLNVITAKSNPVVYYWKDLPKFMTSGESISLKSFFVALADTQPDTVNSLIEKLSNSKLTINDLEDNLLLIEPLLYLRSAYSRVTKGVWYGTATEVVWMIQHNEEFGGPWIPHYGLFDDTVAFSIFVAKGQDAGGLISPKGANVKWYEKGYLNKINGKIYGIASAHVWINEILPPSNYESCTNVTIESNIPSCEKGNTSGYIKDASDWKCIYDVSDTAKKNTYEGNFLYNPIDNNNYCSIVCKQEITYSMPNSFSTSFRAGQHFTFNDENSSEYQVIKPLTFSIKGICQTGHAPGVRLSDDGLEQAYINVDKFKSDYEAADAKVNQAWTDYQMALASEKAVKAANESIKTKNDKNRDTSSDEYIDTSTTTTERKKVWTKKLTYQNCRRMTICIDTCSVKTNCSNDMTTEQKDLSSCECEKANAEIDVISGKITSYKKVVSCSCIFEYKDITNTNESGYYKRGYKVTSTMKYYDEVSGTEKSVSFTAKATYNESTKKYSVTSSASYNGISSSDAYKNYLSAVAERDGLRNKLDQCNNFVNYFNDFDPQVSFVSNKDNSKYGWNGFLTRYISSESYKSYYYSGKSYKDRGKVVETKEWSANSNNNGFVYYSNIDHKNKATLSSKCGASEKKDIHKCSTGVGLTYPTYRFVVQETSITYSYKLPENIYRFVSKDGTSYNSEQDAIKSGAPYIDIGYSNIPIEYQLPEGEYWYKINYYYDNNGSLNLFGKNNKFTKYKIQSGKKETIGNLKFDSKYSYSCSYKVENKLVCTDDECPNGDLKIIFRTISLKNPFLTLDGDERAPGNNWFGNYNLTSTSLEDKFIINNRGVYADEVYNLTPMYEFVLTPENIRAIKKYNNTKNADYNDFNFTCTKDNQCSSTFLKEGISKKYFSFTSNGGGTCYKADSNNWESCRG